MHAPSRCAAGTIGSCPAKETEAPASARERPTSDEQVVEGVSGSKPPARGACPAGGLAVPTCSSLPWRGAHGRAPASGR